MNKNIEKWKKRLKNAATSYEAIGWILTVIAGIFLLIILFSFLGIESMESAANLITALAATRDIVISAVFGLIFVVLGRKINRKKDKNAEWPNIPKYLKILLILSIVLLFSKGVSGGLMSLLLILAVIYCILALNAANKLIKIPLPGEES